MAAPSTAPSTAFEAIRYIHNLAPLCLAAWFIGSIVTAFANRSGRAPAQRRDRRQRMLFASLQVTLITAYVSCTSKQPSYDSYLLGAEIFWLPGCPSRGALAGGVSEQGWGPRRTIWCVVN